MDRHEIEKNWSHWKNGIQTHWNKLTSGDIYQIDGMWDHLVSTLVKRYGWSREIAEKEINNWHPQWSDSWNKEEKWDQKQAQKGTHNREQPKETWNQARSEGNWEQKHSKEKGRGWQQPKQENREVRSEGPHKQESQGWNQSSDAWKQSESEKGNKPAKKGANKNKKDQWKEPPGWNEKKRKAG